MDKELQLQTKECNVCHVRKLLKDFSKKKTGADGYFGICRTCTNSQRQERRRKNPDIVKDECLRRTFGITLEQYKAMLKKQHGVCAICGNPETSTYRGKLRHLSVDHCHKTKKVRGLLCNDCNVALGWFKDDISSLNSTIHYLESS